jgi:hypothetical protein
MPIPSDLSDFPLANGCGNGMYVFIISWMCVSRFPHRSRPMPQWRVTTAHSRLWRRFFVSLITIYRLWICRAFLSTCRTIVATRLVQFRISWICVHVSGDKANRDQRKFVPAQIRLPGRIRRRVEKAIPKTWKGREMAENGCSRLLFLAIWLNLKRTS